MKKIKNVLRNVATIVACLAVVVIFSACGGNSNTNNTTSEKNSAPKNGVLFDIPVDEIKSYKVDLNTFSQTPITGEARTKMINAIPAVILKGVGELMKGVNTIQENSITGKGYIISFQFKAKKSDYNTLTNYYKSLGGTITEEGAGKYLKIDYDWGKLTDCVYLGDDNGGRISVSFNTK